MQNLEAGDLMMRASQNALAAGALTAQEHAQLTEAIGKMSVGGRRELAKLMAIDWSVLITELKDNLPAILSLLIPGGGIWVSLIIKLAPFFFSLINNGPTPGPIPIPFPVPPDGGGVIPNPIA